MGNKSANYSASLIKQYLHKPIYDPQHKRGRTPIKKPSNQKFNILKKIKYKEKLTYQSSISQHERGSHKNGAQIPELNHPPFVSINIFWGEEETKKGR